MSEIKIGKIVTFLWNIAELLRDACKKSENQNFILPLTVLRRLDYALLDTKEEVLKRDLDLKQKGLENRHNQLCSASGFSFYNTSKFTFERLLDDPENLARNLAMYIRSFSENVVEIFQHFEFFHSIERLDKVDRLYHVMGEFNKPEECNLADLSNHEMGYVFEQLIRKFNESVNENPGEHYTPRDAITLLVKIVSSLDNDLAKGKDMSRTVADCCVGTGGILSIFKEEANRINPNAKVYLYGQELNPQSWAICRSDLMIGQPSGQDANNIKLGSTLSNDQFEDMKFDYQFANPPYGTEWKVDKAAVEREADRGQGGRFEAGFPGIADGQLLFLQHMISHMNPASDKPSYIGIFFNGSPLFTGDAGTGPSEIRRWILENDWLDTIIQLPNNIFYNTGITTYLWILSNKKAENKKGKVMLIDASGDEFHQPLKSNLGSKTIEITDQHQAKIVELFKKREVGENVKIFDSTDFGYRQIQVNRPLRLNFNNSDERIKRLRQNKSFLNLATSRKKDKEIKALEESKGKELQEKIIKAIRSLPDEIIKDREVFEENLELELKKSELKLKAPIKKAILNALGERDETAEPCLDKNGIPEPDPELKDHENIPLLDSIDEYMKKEVLPHVPDAWIDSKYRDEKDGGLGRVGYEISFTKYFYKFIPQRNLDEILKDLSDLDSEIKQLSMEMENG